MKYPSLWPMKTENELYPTETEPSARAGVGVEVKTIILLGQVTSEMSIIWRDQICR